MASRYTCNHGSCQSKNPKIFETLASLQNHLKEKHTLLLCSNCQIYIDRRHLKAHNNIHHNGVGLQICKYCKKNFGAKKHSLYRHLKTCKVAISSGHHNFKKDIDSCHKIFFKKKDIEHNGFNNERKMYSLNCRIPKLGFKKSIPPKYRKVGFLNKKKSEIISFF